MQKERVLLTLGLLPGLLLSLLLAVRLSAADKSFTIAQVMSAPFASSLIAAPAGSSIAWLENEAGRRNIWTASGPEWKSKKLTAFAGDDGQEIADLVWSPDGSYLLFARGGDSRTAATIRILI